MHEAIGARRWVARLAGGREKLIVARNILLAETTGARIHCQHLSAAGSVRLLREAKKRSVPISVKRARTTSRLPTPQSQEAKNSGRPMEAGIFGFDSESELPEWAAYDTNFKMNPPLRSAVDREAILAGLADGTIDVLCSDHAPHCDYEKEVEFDYAPFGITGLENRVSAIADAALSHQTAELPKLIAKYTIAPARLLGLAKDFGGGRRRGHHNH